MSWSYYPGESTRDWVRFQIGDTDEDNQRLQDEEIDAALANEGSKYAAAAICCESLAARYATGTSKRVGPLSISGAEKADNYLKLAKRLRAVAGRRVAGWAGGISDSEVEQALQDTDRYEGAFREGMHDVPGSVTELDDDRAYRLP